MIMKAKLLLATCMIMLVSKGYTQGVFHFSNAAARTHIGAIDGPLAGTGIWAQMLAGPAPGSLSPVGGSAQHISLNGAAIGLTEGGTTAVPGIQAFQTAYVQMVAWDGTRWGTVLSGVPPDQLGMTDIVPVLLTSRIGGPPANIPPFTQPAIVPIPEPAVLALAVIGGLGFLLFRRIRHE